MRELFESLYTPGGAEWRVEASAGSFSGLLSSSTTMLREVFFGRPFRQPLSLSLSLRPVLSLTSTLSPDDLANNLLLLVRSGLVALLGEPRGEERQAALLVGLLLAGPTRRRLRSRRKEATNFAGDDAFPLLLLKLTLAAILLL